jgi:hypothetical protein
MGRRGRSAASAVLAAGVLAAGVLGAGCGENVESPDLFLLTRTGQGSKLTLLVNDSGTIRCDGGPVRQLPDPMLLQARDLASSLDKDAKDGLRVAPAAGSVYSYTIKLQDGTISFPDTAAAQHSELAQAELFALQADHGPCRQS